MSVHQRHQLPCSRITAFQRLTQAVIGLAACEGVDELSGLLAKGDKGIVGAINHGPALDRDRPSEGCK